MTAASRPARLAGAPLDRGHLVILLIAVPFVRLGRWQIAALAGHVVSIGYAQRCVAVAVGRTVDSLLFARIRPAAKLT